MKKFVWLSRHELSEEQAGELRSQGFTAARRDVSLPVDEVALAALLESFELQPGDGLGFVAPSVITVRLCRAAESRGIEVWLPEGKPNVAARSTRLLQGLTACEESQHLAQVLVGELPGSLQYNLESGDLTVLGQTPFQHIRFVRV